jgi:ribonuclease-3
LEDVYESFVGALYLDLGKNITKEFILKTIVRFSNEKPENLKQDYKTMLQELVYKIFKTTPVYKQTKNNNVYNTKLFIKNKQYSEANDKKTKEAEQKAAKIAFNLLKN